MSSYIERKDGEQDIILYLSKNAVKTKAFRALRRIKLNIFMSGFAFLFSPILGFFLLFYSFAIFYKDIYLLIFFNKKLFLKYYSFFSPSLDETALSVVGYKVEWEEVDEHLALISNGTKEEIAQKLKAKQKKMMHPSNISRWVGLGLKRLVTHIIAIGRTGSGKTEAIRSIADASMRFGGGFVFNDGKSEESMLIEIATQAKKANRETSFFALNYLKGEKMSESNTLNPIAMMHPIKSVEFLGGLIHKGGGDGTKEYFFNRGKVLLGGGVNGLYLRREIVGEAFDFDKIMETRNIKAFVILELLFYCMCRDINNIIADNKKIVSRLNSFGSTFSDENLKYLHLLTLYVTQYPSEKDMVEKELGVKYITIKEIYNNTYLMMKNYLDSIWNQYGIFLDSIGRMLYAKGKMNEKVFFSSDKDDSIMGYEDFKKNIYEDLKREIVSEDKEELRKIMKNQKLFNLTTADIQIVRDGLTRKKAQGGNIEDVPEDAIQQHQYASQQWDELATVFTNYKHIFGQTKSEIDPIRLMLDNKILYVLIPVMEISPAFSQILGKITVSLIKEIASVALAGEVISVHKTLKRIMKDKASPKPFSLVALDEYGSYPVPNVDDLLKQLRSLLISMILGIQNFAGLKTDGDNVTSQENLLANSLKWFTGTEDKTAFEWAKQMITEDEVLRSDIQVDAFGNAVNSVSTRIEKQKSFDVEKLMDFNYGFSLLFAGSGKEKVVPMQSFYRGGERETIHLKRYTPISF